MCEKRTFDQYVEIFKENNPQILQSILEYRNQHGESKDDMENDSDLTQEMSNTEEDKIDYNFYYENFLQWNQKDKEPNERVDGATVCIADTSGIHIVTVSISLRIWHKEKIIILHNVRSNLCTCLLLNFISFIFQFVPCISSIITNVIMKFTLINLFKIKIAVLQIKPILLVSCKLMRFNRTKSTDRL